jgi:hypothetical protein
MRKIEIFSTKGVQFTEIESSAATWGELKKELIANYNYDLNGLVASENLRRTTLSNHDSTLPEGPFILFLRQSDAKGGVELSYAELRKIASEHDEFKKYLKECFSNYTHCTKAQLQDAYSHFFGIEEEEMSNDFISAIFAEIRVNLEEVSALVDELEEELKKGSDSNTLTDALTEKVAFAKRAFESFQSTIIN